MPISNLGQASSFNPGADLWIIPSLKQSHLAQKLDWYLNFQLTKATNHQTAEISKPMKQLLEDCGLTEVRFNAQSKERMMVNSSSLLPNKWLVQINVVSDFAAWVETACDIWMNLQKPSLRIFLPSGMAPGEFQKFWQRNNSFDDFTVVVD